MVTEKDYPRVEVDACLSVLVELMTLLGEYREHIVLAGGWIPYFLCEEKREQHTGSLDIDIALNMESISDASYRTLLQLFKERGYIQGEQPFIFYRTVDIPDGNSLRVEIDLLAAEYGGTKESHRTQKIQDIRARKARGCDLLFQNSFAVMLKGRMPDGAVNEVRFKVAGVVSFLVMKGMSLWERYKEKDAFDIYFTILNYPGGSKALREAFEPYNDNKLVREGLGKIKAKFQDLDGSGPVWVANFKALDDAATRERMKRDAFERVNAFLDSMDIDVFQE